MVVMCITQCIYIASASNSDVSKYSRTGQETTYNTISQELTLNLSLNYIASCCQELSSHLSYCPLPKV